MLADTGTEGVVVVARWYGGQNIGPIRFTHIETCAKQAIWSWKVAEDASKKEHAVKRQRVEEAAKRKELEDNLRERDLNIFVLRGLLNDKKAKLEGTAPAPLTPSKGLQDYGKMSLEALKRVDKARDATIAFILKQIDKVEEQLKDAEASNDLTEEDWKDAEEAFAARDAASPGDKGPAK